MPSVRPIAAGLAALICAACTDMSTFSRPDLPESLGGKGAVIVEVHGIGVWTYLMDVWINNHKQGDVRGSYFAATLSPGEYTLNKLSRESSGPSGGYGGVNVSLFNVKSFPVERHFTVRAGEITNLGELVLLLDPRTPDSKQFVIRTVDNTADARVFLQSHYPKLLASVKPEALTLASGDYVQGTDLEKLRVYIASTQAKQLRASHYVTGPAGTFAAVDHDRTGTPTRVHLIDFGVTAGIVDAAEQVKRDRFAFQTSDGRLFVLNGGHAVQRPLPEGMELRAGSSDHQLHLAGDRNIVIVERGLNLSISADDGLTWKYASGGAESPGTYSTTGFGADDSGYFVFQSYPPRLLYSPLGEPNLQPVPLPPQMREVRRITALDGAVVLEGLTSLLGETPAPFFVRAHDGDDWQQRLMPDTPRCAPMQFLDQKGERLRTICGTAVYASADGGLHWEPEMQR